MARKTESKLIGDCTYKVTQFGALKGQKVLQRLVSFLGVAMSGEAKALAELPEDSLAYLTAEFSAVSEVMLPDGREPLLKNVFDDHFIARYDEMFEWLTFAIRLNYESFFVQALKRAGGLGQLLQQMQAKTGSTSTPKSGGSGESSSTNESQ